VVRGLRAALPAQARHANAPGRKHGGPLCRQRDCLRPGQRVALGREWIASFDFVVLGRSTLSKMRKRKEKTQAWCNGDNFNDPDH